MKVLKLKKYQLGGIVTYFNQKKGYGFIKCLSGNDTMKDCIGKSYFVHYTSVIGEGFKTLFKNQAVLFNIIELNDNEDLDVFATNVFPQKTTEAVTFKVVEYIDRDI